MIVRGDMFPPELPMHAWSLQSAPFIGVFNIPESELMLMILSAGKLLIGCAQSKGGTPATS
jgi:hypothetical protein